MMKKAAMLLIILLTGISLLFPQVNGAVVDVQGKTVLHVWGTHQQRGYAHGYLMAQPILDIFNNYFYQIVTMSNPAIYNAVVSFYQGSFSVEQKYEAEAQGIIDGMAAAGADLYIPGLQRLLNKDDLLTVNAIVDITPYLTNIGTQLNMDVHCASLSSWGTATQADTLLAGAGVITRFLDWNIDDTLLDNPVMIVSHPSEPNEQKWISFTYPGLMGALSGISESGKAAFLNMGNLHTVNSTANLHPILLSIRNGLEGNDINYDGDDNLADIYDAIAYENYLSGTIIHAISETLGFTAGIIECNNASGTVMRTWMQDDSIPGMNLAATNHFRAITSPICCSRYAAISDSLYTNGAVSAKRQMAILSGAAGMDNNMMAMQYTPGTGKILWSNAAPTLPAFINPMVALDADELFSYNTSIEDEEAVPPAGRLTVYPNPARQNEMVKVTGNVSGAAVLEVFNLKGQRIASVSSNGNNWQWDGRTMEGKPAGNGLYLLRVIGESGQPQLARVLIVK